MTHEEVYDRMRGHLSTIGIEVDSDSGGVFSSLLHVVAYEVDKVNKRIDEEAQTNVMLSGSHLEALWEQIKSQQERLDALEAVFVEGWKQETEEADFESY